MSTTLNPLKKETLILMDSVSPYLKNKLQYLFYFICKPPFYIRIRIILLFYSFPKEIIYKYYFFKDESHESIYFICLLHQP